MTETTDRDEVEMMAAYVEAGELFSESECARVAAALRALLAERDAAYELGKQHYREKAAELLGAIEWDEGTDFGTSAPQSGQTAPTGTIAQQKRHLTCGTDGVGLDGVE